MAITVEASGTQSATVGTEHSLATATTAGVYIFEVDTAAMAQYDVLELRVKTIILAAGAVRVLFYGAFYGAQNAEDVIKVSIPVPLDATAANLTVSLKQTFGTSRSFPWKLLKSA